MANHIRYFAYGSNLKESRLKQRDVDVIDYKVGYIQDYAFRYNKIGVDQTGKGNIVDKKGSLVWGVFFKILEEDFNHLHESYEVGYRQIEIIGISDGKKFKAKSFVALPENIDDAMVPNSRYHKIVLTGAREKKLPREYVENLDVLD